MSAAVRFRSMGCEVVVGGASDAELQAVRALFERRDLTFSRFIDGSELNRVNAKSGRLVEVSPEFAEMLSLARRAEWETSGLVTPLLGAELDGAGYDRDFDDLGDDPTPAEATPLRSRRLHLDGRTLLAEEGTRLDLNGVVKSRTVDDALRLLKGPGWVSAGGDVATSVSLAVGLSQGGAVALVTGGMATSGSDRRRWLRAGVPQHHLIDPRTGRPSTSPWRQVTACGSSCLGADIAAKWGFLLGPVGPIWLDRRGIPAQFVGATGEVRVNEAWRRSLPDAASCI